MRLDDNIAYLPSIPYDRCQKAHCLFRDYWALANDYFVNKKLAHKKKVCSNGFAVPITYIGVHDMLKAKFKADFASADLQRHSAIQIQKAIAAVSEQIDADCGVISETQGAYTTIVGRAQNVMLVIGHLADAGEDSLILVCEV